MTANFLRASRDDLKRMTSTERTVYVRSRSEAYIATQLRALATARALLRETAAGWEVGGGPFEVELPTVNRIINFLASDEQP